MKRPPPADSTRGVPRLRRPIVWCLTAFLTGAVAMSLEIAAVRLYAPYFGQSVYVWGNVIAVVMSALAIGYAVGGFWADRTRSDTPLYRLLLAAGMYQLFAVYASQPVLARLSPLGDMVGPSLASLLLVVPPLIVLAAAAPYLVRMHAELSHVGRSAGLFSALATLGGIGGVLSTTFLLIPYVGTTTTLIVNSAVCVALAIVGWSGQSLLAAIGLAAVLVLGFTAPPRGVQIPAALFLEESAYNLVAVQRLGDFRALILNQPFGYHTLAREHDEWTGAYYDDFVVGPYLVPTENALILGMGGGESLRVLRRAAPEARVDAVEIDPKVVRVAERFFHLRPDGERLRIHTTDARPFLSRTSQQFDLVQVDLFSGGVFVPFYLTTVEFYRAVKERMSPRSVLMVNVLDVGRDEVLLRAVTATLQAVFPTVWRHSRPEGNHLLLALPYRASLEEIQREFAQSEHPSDPAAKAARIVAGLVQPPLDRAQRPLTDDHAPVERLTRAMLGGRQHATPVTP